MKYTEFVNKSVPETLNYIKTTFTRAKNGSVQKSLAKAIHRIQTDSESSITDVAAYARKHWDMNIRKGTGLQGTYESLKVWTAIQDEEINMSEDDFDRVGIGAVIALSPFLNNEKLADKKSEAIAAFLEVKGALKKLQELKPKQNNTPPKVQTGNNEEVPANVTPLEQDPIPSTEPTSEEESEYEPDITIKGEDYTLISSKIRDRILEDIDDMVAIGDVKLLKGYEDFLLNAATKASEARENIETQKKIA